MSRNNFEAMDLCRPGPGFALASRAGMILFGLNSASMTIGDSLAGERKPYGGTNMKTIRITVLVALLTLFANASAETTVEEVTANPANAVQVSELGTGVTDAIEAYLEERGWGLAARPGNPSGGYIGWGEAPIQTDPSDERYGRARVAAYYSAYTQAMAEFARTMGINIGVETLSRNFSDEAGVDAMDAETTDSLFRAVSDRLSTLSVAALDRGLERLGADPASLPAFSVSEKRLLAEDLLARRMVVDAAARLRGVRTLATFEDDRTVGVLIIHHPRLERLADRVLSGAAVGPRTVDVEAVMAKIDDLSDTDLLFQHGLRVIPDPQGIPVLISFGQSSPAVTNADSDGQIRMAVSRSRQVAEAQADAGLAEFMNSTVFAASEVDVAAGESIYVEQAGRALVQSEGSDFHEDLNSMIRQTAQASITGVTTVRRWQANHPDTGHLYLGVVRMWTPEQAFQYSGRLRTDVLDAEPDEEQAPEEIDARVRQSKDLTDGDW